MRRLKEGKSGTFGAEFWALLWEFVALSSSCLCTKHSHLDTWAEKRKIEKKEGGSKVHTSSKSAYGLSLFSLSLLTPKFKEESLKISLKLNLQLHPEWLAVLNFLKTKSNLKRYQWSIIFLQKTVRAKCRNCVFQGRNVSFTSSKSLKNCLCKGKKSFPRVKITAPLWTKCLCPYVYGLNSTSSEVWVLPQILGGCSIQLELVLWNFSHWGFKALLLMEENLWGCCSLCYRIE